MSLLGKAAVAMWWSVRPEQRSEFGDWHSHEHFPERMSIPGFRRGSRWSSTTDAEGFFVLYELEQYEVLTSKGYLDRLNAPTPWSRTRGDDGERDTRLGMQDRSHNPTAIALMVDISPVWPCLQVLLNKGLIVREFVECSHQAR